MAASRAALFLAALAIGATWCDVAARDIPVRSKAARAAFQRSNPCPATGLAHGPCKGFIIDHFTPLACGGADLPANMQWQTTEDAKNKDKWETKGCVITKKTGAKFITPWLLTSNYAKANNSPHPATSRRFGVKSADN